MPRPAPFVRPDMQAFLTRLAAIDGPSLAQMSLAEARQSYVALHAMADRPARDLAVIRDLECPGPDGPIALRLYDCKAERGPAPVICFFHGGGFVIGDLETHHALCSEIAAQMDLPVVAVDYRLAPEHPFPAAIQDCESAARWIADNPKLKLGREATGLILMGDSAGGTAAIVTAQALSIAPAQVPLLLQVPIFPLASPAHGSASLVEYGEGFVLTKAAIEFFDAAYKAPRSDPRGFPIWSDHARAPPTVLVTASLDPIRDSGRDYGAALAQAGIDHTHIEARGLTHSFTNLRGAVPSAQTELERIFAAMQVMLGGGPQ